MIRHNVGGIDRVLRVALGGIFLLGGLILLSGKITLGLTLGVVGLLALLTGAVRFCALYIPFGISTAPLGGQPRNQACDCAVPMKAGKGNRATVDPRGIAKEEAAEAMTGARGR
jgi:hypothetical protein